MSVKYNTILPESNQATYSENDNPMFIMTFEGQKMLSGSVYLSATLNVSDTTPANLDGIYYDNSIGGHSFFNTLTTKFKNIGTIETLDNYPRFVGMKADATIDVNDMNMASKLCELRMPDYRHTWVYHTGVGNQNNLAVPVALRDNAADANVHIRPRFYIKIDNVLNNIYSANGAMGQIPFTKTGEISLNIQMASIKEALFGNKLGATGTFNLSNMRLHFMTVADDGKNERFIIRYKQSVPQELNSANSTINAIVPGVIETVNASFIRQSHRNTYLNNNYQREELPNVSDIQFILNDASDSFISFPLDNREEILYNYLLSFGDASHDNIHSDLFKNDKNYGIGLRLPSPMNMSNQKLSININSEVTSTDPMACYIFLHGLLEL